MRKYLLPLAAGVLFAGASSAFAVQTANDSFNVTVTVDKTCTVAATDMDFGSVTNLSGQTASSTVTARKG